MTLFRYNDGVAACPKSVQAFSKSDDIDLEKKIPNGAKRMASITNAHARLHARTVSRAMY